MGFFSWDCKGCGHSIREGRGWMEKAVVQGSDGDTASGSYDGYGRLSGRVGTIELTDCDGFALWHKACFTVLGKPEFTGASRSARDQGTPPADEYREPTTPDHVRALAEIAVTREREDREQARLEMERVKAEYIAEGKPIPSWLE